MNTNLSTLSDDLSNQIFFDHLDQKSRFECTQLNKKIHTQIWSKLLKDFEIAPNENATPYSEVLKYYRKYNHYFQKKLPSTFVLINPKTITDVKNQIDAKLSLPGTMPIIPLLDEVWNAFIYELEPYQQYFLSDVTPKHRMTIISNPLSNLNEEISFLMTSGIRPRSISPLIKQQWCSLETVQLLLNKKVPICPDDVLTAIRCDRYQEILTIFFKSMIGDDYYLRMLLEGVPSDYKTLVNDYADKVVQVSPYNIRLALQKKYDDQFILKLLGKCIENLDAYHLRLAVEGDRSENLTEELLKRIYTDVDSYHIRIAIEHNCSKELITMILMKLDTKTENGCVHPRSIGDALSKLYPLELILLLMEKVKKSELALALEYMIESKSYPETVKEWLPKAEGTFKPTIFRYLDLTKFDEKTFLTIFAMTDQNKSINEISLDKVIKVYSAKTAELLLSNKITVYSYNLNTALQSHYPEDTILKIIDQMRDTINPESVNIAMQNSYSQELINTIKSKLPQDGSCSIS